MPAMYKGKIPIIKNDLNEGFIRGTPDHEPSTGAIERDFDIDPVMMGDSPAGIQLIDQSEWDARFDEQEATESSLEHMYLRGGNPAFEFLDQNGFPDCWCHSTAHGMMMDRVRQNLPVLRFNAVAMATMMNQLNGGWCGLSLKFAREKGCPVVGNGVGEWPYQSRKGKVTPELQAAMALHKSLEDVYDLGKREYDQVLAKNQITTLSFNNHPMPADWMPYGHSMLLVRAVRIEANHWLPLILNSWQGFGFHGLAVLPIWPNNAVAIRSTTSSDK